MTGGKRDLEYHRRAIMEAAKHSVRDVFDAIVELVTNADDRYQLLGTEGEIQIEIERRRKGGVSLVRVRDFADGMDANTMDKKLSGAGGRVSGYKDGKPVRGTHSRGAKDIAALGRVVFESIAQDGRFHKCEITPFFKFDPPESSETSGSIRRRIGITKGTGTLVTLEIDSGMHSIPTHKKLRDQLSRLVSLRLVLLDPRRRVFLRDLGQDRKSELRVPSVDGTDRPKQTFEVPGYPGVKAKLFMTRAKQRFERERHRFRLGGFLVLSRRTVHEATLFDSALETNAHALWFHGRLVCHYLDDLSNEFDDRFAAEQMGTPANPYPIADPGRRAGLVRDHPFTKALFGEALKRFRPLVEEERQREEKQRASVESRATRKRLDALERAAVKFLRDFGSEDEPAREPDSEQLGSRFRERGYVLSPPFTQMVVGHSRSFWFNAHQETFPELEVGSTVQIECLSADIVSDKRLCGLETHPAREGVLRAIWKVKATKAPAATGLQVRVGPITCDNVIEVLNSEADKYSHVKGLCFSRKRYRMRTDQKRKKVRLLAPVAFVSEPTIIEVSCTSSHFSISGECVMKPLADLGVAVCDLGVKSDGKEAHGEITARLGEHEASAIIESLQPLGAGLSIKLEDVDLRNQRYRWRQNVLEIAARHPSLKRYLGPKSEKFPGQESKHFRVLIAEIVADAVCALLVGRNVRANPEEYEDADWDQYYAEYTKLMTQFLPVAHKLQCPQA